MPSKKNWVVIVMDESRDFWVRDGYVFGPFTRKQAVSRADWISDKLDELRDQQARSASLAYGMYHRLDYTVDYCLIDELEHREVPQFIKNIEAGLKYEEETTERCECCGQPLPH